MKVTAAELDFCAFIFLYREFKCYLARDWFVHKFMHQGWNGRIKYEGDQEEECKDADNT